MRKAAFEGITIILVFFLIWFSLKQINWLSFFRIETNKEKFEQKLGGIFWDVFRNTNEENNDQYICNSIDSIVTKICSDNGINKNNLKIHVVNNDDVNAFALPDGHLVVNSGLLSAAEKQEELCGVICHEIAHIELNHVMKKLVKEVGLNILLSMTTNTGSDITRNATGLLSSTAYDRTLETEADLKAIEYLVNADINPRPFADFLYRISEEKNNTGYLTWISTHPDAEERSAEILAQVGEQDFSCDPILSYSTWEYIRKNSGIGPGNE